MVVQLQLVFNEADKKRNRLRELKAMIKEQIEGKQEYQEIKETGDALKARKKNLIAVVNADNKTECDEIDSLKLDLKSQKQLISDVAISDYVSGKEVRVTDSYGRILEPVFSVKFVKTGNIEEEEKKPKKEKVTERLNLE